MLKEDRESASEVPRHGHVKISVLHSSGHSTQPDHPLSGPWATAEGVGPRAAEPRWDSLAWWSQLGCYLPCRTMSLHQAGSQSDVTFPSTKRGCERAAVLSYLYVAAWRCEDFTERPGELKHLNKTRWKLENEGCVEMKSWKAKRETLSACVPVRRGVSRCFCLSSFLWCTQFPLSKQYFLSLVLYCTRLC